MFVSNVAYLVRDIRSFR